MSTPSNPLVSVVVTTFNQAAYIQETLLSVLAQTYAPLEIIVVDDGSVDDTAARIAFFGSRVVYVRQSNEGIASSRNRGIRMARGEFVALLDGDDLWEPEKISVQVREALNHPGSGLIVADGVEFNQSGIMGRTLLFGPSARDLPAGTVVTGPFYRQLLRGPFISTTSQVMIPSEVFRTVGLSNGRYKRASDYDLYLRIASKYDITIIREPLTRWRCSPSSASGPIGLRPFQYLPEDVAILKNHLRECPNSVRRLVHGMVKEKLAQGAEALYRYGLSIDRRVATRFLLRLLQENPGSLMTAAFLAGLWCPQVLARMVSGPLRKMITAVAGNPFAPNPPP